MRRSIILLCLVLCLIAFWLMRPAWEPKETKKPVSESNRMVLDTPKPKVAPRPRRDSEEKLPSLNPEQQHTLDQWLRKSGNLESLLKLEEVEVKHATIFQSLIQDADWKMRLKKAAALARQANGEPHATPENTAVRFEFDRIFADEASRRRIATALAADDRKAVGEIYIDRMWALAAEQYFNVEATKRGGLMPEEMTPELRRQLERTNQQP